MQENYIIPSIEDDPIPQTTGDGASAENQTTIFSESSRAEFVRDKETVCQKFSCSLEEDQICRNELSTLFSHPCNKYSCMFWGNCYLCASDRCDGKGAYLFHT